MKNDAYTNTFITYDDDATWLVTYADLMTLLLVFFVLLYSLASFEKEKYKSKVETVLEQLKQDQKPNEILLDLSKESDRKISLEDITGLRSREVTLFRMVNKLVRNTDPDQNITTQSRNGKIIITLSGETLFSSGSAELNPTALPVFKRMVKLFNKFPEYTINIKGHTDNIPISTPAFPSNWELSAIRATTVLKYLISMGIRPQRLTATGYGDIMPRVPNTTDENREKNRRVEFVLEKTEAKN
jgi:chemotaxis protein MotB